MHIFSGEQKLLLADDPPTLCPKGKYCTKRILGVGPGEKDKDEFGTWSCVDEGWQQQNCTKVGPGAFKRGRKVLIMRETIEHKDTLFYNACSQEKKIEGVGCSTIQTLVASMQSGKCVRLIMREPCKDPCSAKQNSDLHFVCRE